MLIVGFVTLVIMRVDSVTSTSFLVSLGDITTLSGSILPGSSGALPGQSSTMSGLSLAADGIGVRKKMSRTGVV
jgi:hypothetical protein